MDLQFVFVAVANFTDEWGQQHYAPPEVVVTPLGANDPSVNFVYFDGHCADASYATAYYDDAVGDDDAYHRNPNYDDNHHKLHYYDYQKICEDGTQLRSRGI